MSTYYFDDRFSYGVQVRFPGGQGWIRSIEQAQVLSEKEKLDVKSAKSPTAPVPNGTIEREKLKKAQAKQARRDQIRRNGGRR